MKAFPLLGVSFKREDVTQCNVQGRVGLLVDYAMRDIIEDRTPLGVANRKMYADSGNAPRNFYFLYKISSKKKKGIIGRIRLMIVFL